MDSFLGNNFENKEIREKKKQDIKNMKLEDRRITVEIPKEYWQKANSSDSFGSVEEFL